MAVYLIFLFLSPLSPLAENYRLQSAYEKNLIIKMVLVSFSHFIFLLLLLLLCMDRGLGVRKALLCLIKSLMQSYAMASSPEGWRIIGHIVA